MADIKAEAKLSVKYIIVGAATTLLSVGVYWALYELLSVGNLPSVAVSWVAAVSFAFFANKLLVFESRTFNKKTLLREAALFLAARVVSGVLEAAAMYLTVDILNQNGTLMKLITNVAVIILNYLFSKLMIFKQK